MDDIANVSQYLTDIFEKKAPARQTKQILCCFVFPHFFLYKKYVARRKTSDAETKTVLTAKTCIETSSQLDMASCLYSRNKDDHLGIWRGGR
jgi:hypothetical protein